MKLRLPVIAVAGALGVLTGGCVDGAAELKVNRDGSGRLALRVFATRDGVERARNSSEFLRMAGIRVPVLDMLGPGAGAENPLISRTQFEQFAREMGPGVRLVSTRRLGAGTARDGVEAIYAVPDLRTLRFDPSAAGEAPAAAPPGLRFDFVRGAAPIFKILPHGRSGGRPAEAAAGGSPAMLERMLNDWLSGFRMRATVTTEGTVVRAGQAAVVPPSTVVLADIRGDRMRAGDLLKLAMARDLGDLVPLSGRSRPGLQVVNPSEPLIIQFR